MLTANLLRFLPEYATLKPFYLELHISTLARKNQKSDVPAAVLVGD